MKRLAISLLAVSIALTALSTLRTPGQAEASLVLGGKMPSGYRDWKLISVAHEEGKLNDLRAVLGNDLAIEAYREGKLPFPDGTIVARLAWSYVPSEENNKAFGRPQSFVAGPPRTFSSWSKIRKSTPRPAAGDSLSLTTADPPTFWCKIALPATCPLRRRITYSPITHREAERGTAPARYRTFR